MLKEIIQLVFKEVLLSQIYDEDLIDKYFSKDYVQFVDGKQIGFADFKEHIRTLKNTIRDQQLEIKSIAEEGDTVFTNHLVTLVVPGEGTVQTKVMAEFRIRDNQLYYCDELTFMIKGDSAHRDLGSRIG